MCCRPPLPPARTGSPSERPPPRRPPVGREDDTVGSKQNKTNKITQNDCISVDRCPSPSCPAARPAGTVGGRARTRPRQKKRSSRAPSQRNRATLTGQPLGQSLLLTWMTLAVSTAFEASKHVCITVCMYESRLLCTGCFNSFPFFLFLSPLLLSPPSPASPQFIA